MKEVLVELIQKSLETKTDIKTLINDHPEKEALLGHLMKSQSEEAPSTEEENTAEEPKEEAPQPQFDSSLTGEFSLGASLVPTKFGNAIVNTKKNK